MIEPQKKTKIQQLKRKHNQKDAGLKRKTKSPLQNFCAELQAVFFPQPLWVIINVILQSIVRLKQKKAYFVML